MYDQLTCHSLDGKHEFWTGLLPEELHLSAEASERLWMLHPQEYHEIKMHGRLVKTPRWQQAYGADYYYTGNVNKALPIPTLLEPLHQWVKENVDLRLNGILINWYDGKLGHYIGKHRDDMTDLVEGSPIVTISFGEERVFRLRPVKQGGYLDFPTRHGSIFVMSYATNQAWKHEVPRSKRYAGQRISITFRAFN
jgi:alkylated DNA repair dioxygenase AlkB